MDEEAHYAIFIDKASFAWAWEEDEGDFTMEVSETEELGRECGFLLRNLMVSVKRGELIMVIGEVGSGKSSFLSAILGEMLCTSKFFQISSIGHNNSSEDNKILDNNSDSEDNAPITLGGSISYVQQNSWIQNKTIKENIVSLSDNQEYVLNS